MNIDDVKAKLAEVAEHDRKGDYEAAHGEEDRLIHWFVREVADGRLDLKKARVVARLIADYTASEPDGPKKRWTA